MKTQGIFRSDLSPARRVSRIDFNLISEAYSQGGTVNIFDLGDLINKHAQDSVLDFKILEGLKPAHMISEEGGDLTS